MMLPRKAWITATLGIAVGLLLVPFALDVREAVLLSRTVTGGLPGKSLSEILSKSMSKVKHGLRFEVYCCRPDAKEQCSREYVSSKKSTVCEGAETAFVTQDECGKLCKPNVEKKYSETLENGQKLIFCCDKSVADAPVCKGVVDSGGNGDRACAEVYNINGSPDLTARECAEICDAQSYYCIAKPKKDAEGIERACVNSQITVDGNELKPPFKKTEGEKPAPGDRVVDGPTADQGFVTKDFCDQECMTGYCCVTQGSDCELQQEGQKCDPGNFFSFLKDGGSLTAEVVASKEVVASMKNNTFNPGSITIEKGTTITWKNEDTAPHTVTADGKGPKSETLQKGASYSFTFDEIGTFPYHCEIHGGMKATVTVTEPTEKKPAGEKPKPEPIGNVRNACNAKCKPQNQPSKTKTSPSTNAPSTNPSNNPSSAQQKDTPFCCNPQVPVCIQAAPQGQNPLPPATPGNGAPLAPPQQQVPLGNTGLSTINPAAQKTQLAPAAQNQYFPQTNTTTPAIPDPSSTFRPSLIDIFARAMANILESAGYNFGAAVTTNVEQAKPDGSLKPQDTSPKPIPAPQPTPEANQVPQQQQSQSQAQQPLVCPQGTTMFKSEQECKQQCTQGGGQGKNPQGQAAAGQQPSGGGGGGQQPSGGGGGGQAPSGGGAAGQAPSGGTTAGIRPITPIAPQSSSSSRLSSSSSLSARPFCPEASCTPTGPRCARGFRPTCVSPQQATCVANVALCCTDARNCNPVRCEPDIQQCADDFDCGYSACEEKNGRFESCTIGIACVQGRCQRTGQIRCKDCNECAPAPRSSASSSRQSSFSASSVSSSSASSVSSAVSSSSASSVSSVNRCGNRTQDAGEQCGEPGLNCPLGQTCSNCQCSGGPFCGNSKQDQGEQCGEPGLFCPQEQTCLLNKCLCSGGGLCGNGRRDGNEKCGEPGLFCPESQTCSLNTCLCSGGPLCGNTVKNSGEECGEPGLFCRLNEVCNLNTCQCFEGRGSSSSSSSIQSSVPFSVNVNVNANAVASATAIIEPQSLCRNDKQDVGEQCGEPGLLCPQGQICDTTRCTCEERSYCGNGKSDRGEQCGEPGLFCGAGQSCDYARCICSGGGLCGNGSKDTGEQCGEPGLSCPASQLCIESKCACIASNLCGNGTAESGEQCGEPGLTCGSTQVCAANVCLCVTPPSEVFLCGNGRLDKGEGCDDGNTRDYDGCSSRCQLERGVCGDGIVQNALGEQCEISTYIDTLTTVCGADCRIRSFVCGDGKVDAGEQCDDGTRNTEAPGGHCRLNCSFGRCGDGILDTPAEQCDDKNRLDADGCDRFCQKELRAPQNPLQANVVPTTPSPIVPQALLPGQKAPGQPSRGPAAPGIPPVTATVVRPFKEEPLQKTGPAVVAIMAAGAAGGYAWMRRKRKS